MWTSDSSQSSSNNCGSWNNSSCNYTSWNYTSSSDSSINIGSRGCDFSFRVMNNLSFNWNILNSLSNDILSNIINNSLLDNIRNVLDLIFHSIVILDYSLNWNSLCSNNLVKFSNHSLDWDLFDSLNLLVDNFSLLIGNVLNSTLSGNLLNNGFVIDWSRLNQSSWGDTSCMISCSCQASSQSSCS